MTWELSNMANVDTVRFLSELRRYKGALSKQIIKTLRGQALSGDLEGARKGLCTVLRRRVGSSGKAQ